MKRWIAGASVIALVGLSLLAGCQTPPQAAARASAAERWNVARGQVKVRLAAEQLAAGNTEAAGGQLAEARQLDPNNPELAPLQARLLLADGALDRAADLLEQASNAATRAECSYLLGVVRQQQQRLSDAAAAFDQALDGDPRELSYFVAAVQARLQLGDPATALECLKNRAEQFGWTPAYQAALAECHEQFGDWSAAAAAWRRVVDAPGADAGIRERLGYALLRAGRFAEAVPVLEEVITAAEPAQAHAPTGDKAPDDAALRLLLAEAALGAGRPAVAREQAQQVLRRIRDHGEALRLLAVAHAKLGDPALGLQTAQRALARNRTHVPTLELVAALAWRAGDLQLATVTARALVSAQADSRVARHILARATPERKPRP